MEEFSEYLVSASGQMSVPAAFRRRWGLEYGGPVRVLDLGDVLVVMAPEAGERLFDATLSADEHASFVADIDDPDLATT